MAGARNTFVGRSAGEDRNGGPEVSVDKVEYSGMILILFLSRSEQSQKRVVD